MKIEKAMRNVLANTHNHYQGDAKRVLCICSAGILRSSSCANVLHREFDYNTRAAGVDLEYALTPINHQLIEWADEIVCAEAWHSGEVKTLIYDLYETAADEVLKEKPIITLSIADRYGYMDEELQELIITKYKEADTMSALQEKINKDLNIRD